MHWSLTNEEEEEADRSIDVIIVLDSVLQRLDDNGYTAFSTGKPGFISISGCVFYISHAILTLLTHRQMRQRAYIFHL